MLKDSKILPFDGCIILVDRLVDEFNFCANGSDIPNKKLYKVAHREEPLNIERSARIAALNTINKLSFSIRKNAFDTRRVNQLGMRIPRTNLQFYNRSQQYLDGELDYRVEAFGKLIKPLEEIKSKYGDNPEYFHSYARGLLESVKRITKLGKRELNIFRPQVDYLEQLLYARYRLGIDDIAKFSSYELYDKIIKRDEDLIRKATYLKVTDDNDERENIISSTKNKKENIVIKDGDNKNTQEAIISAIFGKDLRRDGEKKITRTITIKISDEVVD